MKKVLILHTSVGLGHKSMAENIAWHFEKQGFETKVYDITHAGNGPLDNVLARFHFFVNKYLPFVWGFLYKWGHWTFYPFRLFIAKFHSGKTLKVITEYKPDLVIATQTTASGMVAYLKKSGKFTGEFGIAFSDYHLHPYWLYRQADFYLANIPEQKQEMMAKGFPQDKIFVCGMSLKPRLQVNADEIKARFGIKSDEKVVLVGAGSLGIGFDLNNLLTLGKLSKVRIIFFCGKNQELYDKILRLKLSCATVLGFYVPMDELYAIADIFVTKPGGLTVAEALAWRLPMLITFTLPGQEVLNYEYLVKRHLIMPTPKDLFTEVAKELETGEFRKQLLNNSYIEPIVGKEVLETEVLPVLNRSQKGSLS